MRIVGNGDLVIDTAAGEFSLQKPPAYQMAGGLRRPVGCRYVLKSTRHQFFPLDVIK